MGSGSFHLVSSYQNEAWSMLRCSLWLNNIQPWPVPPVPLGSVLNVPGVEGLVHLPDGTSPSQSRVIHQRYGNGVP